MRDWQSMDTMPLDGSMMWLRMSDGRETVGEYWEPAPVELDPQQISGGLAWDVMPLGLDCDAEPVAWAPYDGPEIECPVPE